MLKKAVLSKIADLLKIDKTKWEAAIASEKEEDIEIPEDLTVFNKAELDTLKRNTYDPAKKAGEEMLIKEMKKKHGLEFTGEDPDKLVEALQKKVKAEVDLNPDARIVELTKTVESTKKALAKANETADHFKSQMENFQVDTKLLAMLPNNRSEVMSNDEFLNLTKNAIKIETRDGKEVAIRNGAVVVNEKTQEPIAPSEVINGYFKERKGWLKEEAAAGGGNGLGRGGGNSQHLGLKGKYSKVSQLEAELEAEKISPNGEEYTKRIQAAMKDNPEMDMKS